jgi:GTP-binding protein
MIAKVSSTPGKTKLINFFKVRFKNQNGEDGFMNFVDLPGYGYAKVSFAEREKWKKIINTYLSEREGLKGIIMLVDIRHKADKKDVMMADYLKSYRIPYLIVATKSDKIKKTLIGKTIKKLSAEFGVTPQEILPFSSLKKNGMEDVLKWIETKIL